MRDGEAPGERPDGTSLAIETISLAYGNQAVVVSVDPRRIYVDPTEYDGPFKSEVVTRQLSGVQLVQGVQLLGAGEDLAQQHRS